MELLFKEKKIILKNKELTLLDEFVEEFVKILEKHVNYVIVSGYTAILFGRSRGTEDIDILVDELSKEKFDSLYNELSHGYDFLNPEDREGLFNMLKDKLAIRMAKKEEIIPNIELKFVRYSFERYALKNSITLEIDDFKCNISPLELQIAYKLYLGSEKDILDARYIYNIFKTYLDISELDKWIHQLKADKRLLENEAI